MPRITHFDLPADDPVTLKKFYEDVFDWKFNKWTDPTGEIEYWMITTGSDDEPGINGGMGKKQLPNQGISNSISVDDLDAYISKVEANGGNIIEPKMPIFGVGWMATFVDPQGNITMMMQDDPEAK